MVSFVIPAKVSIQWPVVLTQKNPHDLVTQSPLQFLNKKITDLSQPKSPQSYTELRTPAPVAVEVERRLPRIRAAVAVGECQRLGLGLWSAEVRGAAGGSFLDIF